MFFSKKKEDRPTRQTMKPSLCVLCWCFIINPSVLSIFAQIDRLDNVTDEGTKQLIVFFYFFLFHTERRHFAIAAGLTHYILYIHLCWIVLFWRYYTDKKKQRRKRSCCCCSIQKQLTDVMIDEQQGTEPSASLSFLNSRSRATTYTHTHTLYVLSF